MKKYYLLLTLFSFVSLFAQSLEKEMTELVNAERKSASKRMNLVTNPNTDNYDIIYHRLKFNVDPAIYAVSGEVTTKYIAKQSMNTVTFDLSNDLTVSTVKQRGNILNFTRSTNNEVIINLPVTQNINVTDSVSITYSGIPPTTGFGAFSIDEHSNTPVLWTLSEPFGAMEWWPCKQDLNDKVNSIDVFITAPSQYNSVANGLQQAKVDNGNGTSTTHFKHNYPIPAYLIAIAVSNYQIYNQQGGLGTTESPYFPIINYMYPETATNNIASVAPTPNIINFFETTFGLYPFRNEKYGHAEFGWGGGMEHTTVSFMGGWGRSLIAHEMAHQWFGDKITCGSWKDIWLNEGITEYMSGCVVENLDGAASFVSWKNNKINSITSTANGNLYLTDAQITNVNRIFSSQMTYDKGSMVTNMLRFKMGDANFFQALRNYLSDPALAYAYAVTPQFQTHLETVYGSSLQEFFNDWVYNEGYPTYTINTFNSGAGQATVQINQTQSITNPAQIGYVSYFEMPVPVRLTLNDGQILDVVLENTVNGQSFNVAIPVGKTVTGIVFDPNKNIISRNSTVTLGLDNFNYDTALNMYPNPASDILNIDLPANMTLQKVSLYNTLGQKSLETNLNKIDVSGLSTGMYIVNFETSAGTFHKNFIKK